MNGIGSINNNSAPSIEDKAAIKKYRKTLEFSFCEKLNNQEYSLAFKDAKKIRKIKPSLGHYYLSLVSKAVSDNFMTMSAQSRQEPASVIKNHFKQQAKLYKQERNISGMAFQSANIYIKWFPPSVSPSDKEAYALALKARAKMFLTMDSPKDALKDLEEAKNLTPNRSGIYRQMALAHAQIAAGHQRATLSPQEAPPWIKKPSL